MRAAVANTDIQVHKETEGYLVDVKFESGWFSTSLSGVAQDGHQHECKFKGPCSRTPVLAEDEGNYLGQKGERVSQCVALFFCGKNLLEVLGDLSEEFQKANALPRNGHILEKKMEWKRVGNDRGSLSVSVE